MTAAAKFQSCEENSEGHGARVSFGEPFQVLFLPLYGPSSEAFDFIMFSTY
jgi:hypothetical protein